jgi:hypothetical protein
VAVLACASAAADPAPPAVRAEIEALLVRLQAPGCQFYRNGAWHSGAEAQAHLRRKLEYLEGKNLVKTTEDFINLAASASSMSGEPYLVRCGALPSIESKAWLQQQLGEMRRSR